MLASVGPSYSANRPTRAVIAFTYSTLLARRCVCAATLIGHCQSRAMSASLIGRLGSSAFRVPTTAASISLTGSRFSSESAPRPLYGAFLVKRFKQGGASFFLRHFLLDLKACFFVPIRTSLTPAVVWRCRAFDRSRAATPAQPARHDSVAVCDRSSHLCQRCPAHA